MITQHARAIAPGSIELGPIPFDLYASDPNDRIILFCRAGFEITPRHKRLLNDSERSYYISSADVDRYLDYAFDRIERIIGNRSIRVKEKAGIIHAVGKRVVQHLLENPRSEAVVPHCRRFVESHIELILESGGAAGTLFALSSNDPYTYSHSINVCTFCLSLGDLLFGGDREKLSLLGLGGLLHDIGKTRIDPAILFKPDPLSEKEWQEVRRHTLYGYEMGSEHGLPEPVLLMIRNHHERVDGSGYPGGLRGDEISLLAKIAAVADIYDAVTSDRFYAKQLPHVQALVEISVEADSLDRDVYDALLQIVLRNDKLIDQFRARRLGFPHSTALTSKPLHIAGRNIGTRQRR